MAATTSTEGYVSAHRRRDQLERTSRVYIRHQPQRRDRIYQGRLYSYNLEINYTAHKRIRVSLNTFAVVVGCSKTRLSKPNSPL